MDILLRLLMMYTIAAAVAAAAAVCVTACTLLMLYLALHNTTCSSGTTPTDRLAPQAAANLCVDAPTWNNGEQVGKAG
jgi:hypothetical protein